MYLACTFLGPFIYPRYTWGRLCAGPGPRTTVVRRPSPFTSGAGLEGRRRPVVGARARFLPSPEDRAGPGGRQVPLVFSAWDSATRNAATAVVNKGANAPPAPPAPCQVTSQVIVAVAWNAPPGCPALEAV